MRNVMGNEIETRGSISLHCSHLAPIKGAPKRRDRLTIEDKATNYTRMSLEWRRALENDNYY